MCRALPDPSRPRLGGRAACCLSRRPFPRRRSPVKKYIIAVLLGTGAVGAIGAGMLTSAPASAQISVFDPANYRQNLLTAARTLSQINNQLHILPPSPQMFLNPCTNLPPLSP